MKVSLGRKTLLLTHPVLIVGSYDKDDKPNILAVSWGGICNSGPPSITISLRESRYSYQGILDSGAFTVNIPSADQAEAADFVGFKSGRDMDKFNETGLTPVRSEIVNAPYIKEFPINIMCKLIKHEDLGYHTQFIGEIVDIIADESVLNDKGMPDIKKVNPFIYDTVSKSYFGIAEKIRKSGV